MELDWRTRPSIWENQGSIYLYPSILKYFDSTQPTELQCDASETGLGATLTQHGQPVAYVSRALSATERNYAQIEKELLAIVFGLERFHQYTYGRRITVESDHKPLEIIHKKPLASEPKRVQRMLLATLTGIWHRDTLQARKIHLSRRYTLQSIPSHRRRAWKEREKVQAIAQHSSSKQSTTTIEVAQTKHAEYVPISKPTLTKIQEASKEDPTVKQLKSFIHKVGRNQRINYPLLCNPILVYEMSGPHRMMWYFVGHGVLYPSLWDELY